MELNQRKEQFSKAYVRAVAAVVGLRVAEPNPDDDDIDLILRARGAVGAGNAISPQVDLQLKCTANRAFVDGHLAFPLPIGNYNGLRQETVMVPRILVVVTVPEEIDRWLLHDEERLALHHCGYWLSLKGRASMSNAVSVTVKLPQTQVFDVKGLTRLMAAIGSGLPI